MTISPQSQYKAIQTALETGQTLAFDKQENRFTVLSAISFLTPERYITDLDSLKEKVVSFVKENGIEDVQLKTLTLAFEKAVKKAGTSKQVKQLKEFSGAIQKAAEQAKKISRQIPTQAASGKAAIPTGVPQQQLSEALSAKTLISKEQPEAINQMVEAFQTERTLYEQNLHLNTLFHDPDFIKILKDKKIGGKSLNDLEINTLGNFGPVLRESGEMMVGLHEINKLIREQKYQEATHSYISLIGEQYGSYSSALEERTQAYFGLFMPYSKKLEAAEKEYQRLYPAKHKKTFADRQSIAGKAITSVQRGPRHELMAATIIKKTEDPALKKELSDMAAAVKSANKSIDQAIEQSEADFKSLSDAGKFSEALLVEDPEWDQRLADVGLDRGTVARLGGWYDAVGKTIAELALPIRALEEDPDNRALQNAIIPPLQKLQREMLAAGIDVTNWAGLDEGLEKLDQAITSSKKEIPPYGTLMRERINTVIGWMRNFT